MHLLKPFYTDFRGTTLVSHKYLKGLEPMRTIVEESCIILIQAINVCLLFKLFYYKMFNWKNPVNK